MDDVFYQVKEYRLIAYATADLQMFAVCLNNKHEIIKAWSLIGDRILPEFAVTLEDMLVQSLVKLWRLPKGYYEHLIIWYLVAFTTDYIAGTSYVRSLRHFWVSYNN